MLWESHEPNSANFLRERQFTFIYAPLETIAGDWQLFGQAPMGSNIQALCEISRRYLFFLGNDNDNDNEIIFIANWHTIHVQRTWVKNTGGRINIHEIYKTWQRGLKPWWLMFPNINYIKQIVLGVQNRNSAECWSSFSIKHFLSCTCIPTYIPHIAHIYACLHIYTQRKLHYHWCLPALNIAESCNKVIVWKTRTIFGCVSWMGQLHISNQYYQEYNSRYEHRNNLTIFVHWKYTYTCCVDAFLVSYSWTSASLEKRLSNTSGSNWLEYLYIIQLIHRCHNLDNLQTHIPSEWPNW